VTRYSSLITHHSSKMTPATVYLVGAGPRQSGLLTLRAVECLQQADSSSLRQTRPATGARIRPPGRRARLRHRTRRLPHERYAPVQQAMIEAARQGRCVVRLKGGDPYLFGRGGEEAECPAARRHSL